MDNLPYNQSNIISRELALQILISDIKNPQIIEHCLDVEASMKVIYEYIYKNSIKNDADLIRWQVTGLLHDADYELAKGRPQRQGRILQQKELIKIPDDVSYAITSRNFSDNHIQPHSLLDWSLICCDDLTLIIKAVSKVNRTSVQNLTINDIFNNYQKESTAHTKQKQLIQNCETKLNIPLNTFIELIFNAVKNADSQSIVAKLLAPSYTNKSEGSNV